MKYKDDLLLRKFYDGVWAGLFLMSSIRILNDLFFFGTINIMVILITIVSILLCWLVCKLGSWATHKIFEVLCKYE